MKASLISLKSFLFVGIVPCLCVIVPRQSNATEIHEGPDLPTGQITQPTMKKGRKIPIQQYLLDDKGNPMFQKARLEIMISKKLRFQS